MEWKDYEDHIQHRNCKGVLSPTTSGHAKGNKEWACSTKFNSLFVSWDGAPCLVDSPYRGDDAFTLRRVSFIGPEKLRIFK